MDDTRLEEAMARAATIASKLPTNLQEAAFNRALDALLDTPTATARRPGRRAAPLPPRGEVGRPGSSEAVADNLLNSIDRTRYPDIGATQRVADRALKVLHLAHADHGVDGLTAGEIAAILSTKFRLTVKEGAVRMALAREVGAVDVRHRSDGKQAFHIMEPGEQYLARLRSQSTEPTSATKPRKRGASRRASPRPAVDQPKGQPRRQTRTSATRPGPKAAIEALIASGYFDSARIINDVREELRHSRGNTYSLQELSPALVRCLRDLALKRSRNAAGQYEYIRT